MEDYKQYKLRHMFSNRRMILYASFYVHDTMTFTIRIVLLFITVGLVFENGKCDNSTSKTLKETYVTSMEKSIRTLMKAEQVLQKVITIKNDLKELALDTLSLRKTNNKKKSTMSNIFNPFKSKIKAIFPGTYWCGEGNISSDEEDLGFFENTDACCRDHDLCSDYIPAQEERDGLMNNGIFTRSSCECDGAFYRCLKEANNILATKIGTTYFNILRPQCFQKYYPIEDCKKYSRRRLKNDKCEEYNYNFTLPQIIQWFDNPDFLNL